MVKGLTLTGTEKKVEVSGGLHVFVMNFSTDTELLVSKTPNAVKGKEGTYVIAPKTGIMVQDACTMGTIEGVSDYRGELYAKGNGYVQFVPTNSLNFSVVGGGGDSSSPTPVIENPLHIKGIVATVEDLPETGEVGDMYFVGNPDTDEDLAEYVYIGNKFEKLGTISKDKDLVGILGKLVETVGYEHNNYIAPNGVTFANYKTFAYEEEIEPNLVVRVNGERTNLYSRGELTDAIAVTHFVNSNVTIDSNVEDVYLIADYDVTSDTTSNEAVVGMTYVKLDEGEKVLEFVSLPLDLTDKSDGQRAGIKFPEDAIGIEENVVTLEVNGTGEFDINLRLNLIKVPKGTEIDYDRYKWREPTWNVISSLKSIVSYMDDELPDEIKDRVEANINPRLDDLRDDVDNLIEDMRNKADHSEIIGENLIPTPYFSEYYTKNNAVTITPEEDYTFTVNIEEVTTGYTWYYIVDYMVGIPNLIPGEKYTLSSSNGSDTSEVNVVYGYYNTVTGVGGGGRYAKVNKPMTFTYSPKENQVFYIQLMITNKANPTNEVIHIMLEKGETAHELQPYILSRQSLRKDIESLKINTERVQSETRIVTAPESSTFANVASIKGKTVKTKNLIPFPYQFSSPYTTGAVTYTYDDSGIITANGVDTVNRFPFLNSADNLIKLKRQKYILTGCPSGGSSTTYSLNVAIGTSSSAVLRDTGDGVIIDNTDGTYDAGIRITTLIGTEHTGDTVIFKPMIEEGEVATEYETYFEGLRSAPIEKVVSYTNDNHLNYLKEYNNYQNPCGLIDSKKRCTSDELHIPVSGILNASATHPNRIMELSVVELTNERKVVRQSSWLKKISNYALQSNTKYLRIMVKIDSNMDIPRDNKINFEVNTAYVKSTLQLPPEILNLPDYGCSAGNAYNWVDLENMHYHHNVGSVDMGTLNWKRYAENRFNVTDFIGPYNVKRPATNDDIPNIICAVYPVSSSNEWTSNDLLGICIGDNFNCYDDTVSDDADALKSKLNGVMLNYEFVRPEIIDLKPILCPFSVEPNGKIEFVNEHNLDVPTEVIYKKEG